MGQEFVIKSQILEDKINQLLPSQGGAQAGVDLSASTQIIPIVDLTESAEGSILRQDLQTCTDFATTETTITNATNTTIINTTGFYKLKVVVSSGTGFAILNLFDGATSQRIRNYNLLSSGNILDELIIYLRAGDSLRGTSQNAATDLTVYSRQIADIAGNLTNPLGFVT